MNSKPVKPKMHGMIDYAFSAIQIGVPALLAIRKQTETIYRMSGLGFMVMNALTDTPMGMKRVLPFRGHQKADAAFLAGLSLLTLSKRIRKDKQALGFHLGFLGIAVLHYVLTDYKAAPGK